jgi:hypothetical protein
VWDSDATAEPEGLITPLFVTAHSRCPAQHRLARLPAPWRGHARGVARIHKCWVESHHLESRPKTAARLDIYCVCLPGVTALTLRSEVSGRSLARSPAWIKFTSADFKATADIQELAAFVLKLRPRSVHDFKPMLQLLQGLLSDVCKVR